MSDERVDVFDSYVEEGTTFVRPETGGKVVVRGIAIDEDATVQMYIDDAEEGYENDPITLDDLVEAVEDDDLVREYDHDEVLTSCDECDGEIYYREWHASHKPHEQRDVPYVVAVVAGGVDTSYRRVCRACSEIDADAFPDERP